MTKIELMEHCVRMIKKHSKLPFKHSDKILFEHSVFLALLEGYNVNDMFDIKGEYIEPMRK